MKNLKLSAVMWKEKEGYVSKCPELNVASCGDNVEEALSNLKEAVELYIENAVELGMMDVIEELETYENHFNAVIEVKYGKTADSIG